MEKDLRSDYTVRPDDIRDVRCDHPPGTTQEDLDRIARHKEAVRREVRKYLVKTDAEWKRHIEAGSPDPVQHCIAFGIMPNDTMLRIIARREMT